MSVESAIELQNVSVSFRGRQILEDVNLELETGAFLGLIGPNGGGKTVLLKILLGLIQPTEGSVRIFGQHPRQARSRVGYVPQHASFDADFPIRVFDVVLMGRLGGSRFFGNFSEEDRRIARECLEQVELADCQSRQIGRLSGGQLQRVLIARALASKPQMLLLDEPTASLDSRVGKSVYGLVSELAKTMTIVMVSHDIGVISSHVKTIACLNRHFHYHASKDVSGEVLAEVYGCPVELIAHGHAHRVLGSHEEHS